MKLKFPNLSRFAIAFALLLPVWLLPVMMPTGRTEATVQAQQQPIVKAVDSVGFTVRDVGASAEFFSKVLPSLEC